MDATDQALVDLAEELRRRRYRFTTVTPATHRLVNGRVHTEAGPLQRVFGWSRPFVANDLPSMLVDLLDTAGVLEEHADGLRSAVRFSTLGEQMFVHSAFPTEAPDSVFFGPDTYRFARALKHAVCPSAARMTVVDLGCGSGAGGLHVARLLAGAADYDLILADINPKAVRYSRINARINNVQNVRTVLSDLFSQVNDGGDFIISNPPYLVDSAARTYRHGGGELGFDLSLRIVEESLDRLYPGGRLLLYTGTPVIAGEDAFFEAVRPRLEARQCRYSYEEIDPDVFGEELQAAPYDRVDRIAAVVLTVDVE
jgi:methylase of polypeptide subunit release factors